MKLHRPARQLINECRASIFEVNASLRHSGELSGASLSDDGAPLLLLGNLPFRLQRLQALLVSGSGIASHFLEVAFAKDLAASNFSST